MNLFFSMRFFGNKLIYFFGLNGYTSDEQIKLNGCIPIRKDLPSGTTHGGVMLYHKESLPVIRRPELETQEDSLVCEISINQKKIIVTVTYRRHHHGDANQLNRFPRGGT